CKNFNKPKKILLLSNDNNNYVFAFQKKLKDKNCNVKLYTNHITLDLFKEYSPDLVISYNYRYIVKKDVIDYFGNKIINMHISYLPWNKGSDPNIWSFINNTQKGVTIHRLEERCDTGKIIVQKEIFFNEDIETLSSSYIKLQNEIMDLFINNFDKIITRNYNLTEQKHGGSFHKSAELKAILGDNKIDYNMTISEFKKFILKLMNNK
ncbi:MAG: formyltransferase family protein, partial [Oscillospiraceae bacterium]